MNKHFPRLYFFFRLTTLFKKYKINRPFEVFKFKTYEFKIFRDIMLLVNNNLIIRRKYYVARS